LLLGNWLDALLVVERVPKFGDNEKLFTLDETILDGAGNSLTGLDLVSVVWKMSETAKGYLSAD